jgi:hypothetical protein
MAVIRQKKPSQIQLKLAPFAPDPIYFVEMRHLTRMVLTYGVSWSRMAKKSCNSPSQTPLKLAPFGSVHSMELPPVPCVTAASEDRNNRSRHEKRPPIGGQHRHRFHPVLMGSETPRPGSRPCRLFRSRRPRLFPLGTIPLRLRFRRHARICAVRRSNILGCENPRIPGFQTGPGNSSSKRHFLQAPCVHPPPSIRAEAHYHPSHPSSVQL